MDEQVMQPAPAMPSRGQKSHKKLIIVLAIVAAFFLTGTAIGGYFLYRTLTGPTEAARKVLLDISSGQIQAAYDETSGGFKSAGTVDDFKNFLNNNPELQNTKSVSFSSVNIEGLNAVAKGDVIDASGEPTPVTVTLVNANGIWKVDGITLTGGGGAQNTSDNQAATPPSANGSSAGSGSEAAAPASATGNFPEAPKEGQGIFVQAFIGAQNDHYDIYDASGTRKLDSYLEVNTLSSIAPGTYMVTAYAKKQLVFASHAVVVAGKVTVVRTGAVKLQLVADHVEGDHYDIFDAKGDAKLDSYEPGNSVVTLPLGTYIFYRYATKMAYVSGADITSHTLLTIPMGAIEYDGTDHYDVYDASGTNKLVEYQPNGAVSTFAPGTYLLKKYATDKPLTGVLTVVSGQTTKAQ